MKQIVSEIKTLSPALLNKEGRRQFKVADGKVHGLYCQETPAKRYIVLVNAEPAEQTLDLRTLDGLKDVKELKEVFGDGKQELGKLTLKSYETKVYTW